MALRIEVLGPFQVRIDGTRAHLGGPRARSVLVTLCACPGQPRSVDALAEEVWGRERPAHVRNSLQSHVSRLRTALDDPQRIQLADDCYTLTLTDGELDALELEAGLHQVQEAAACGRTDEVLAASEHLLALWRGPPFTGFEDLPSAVAWAVRLVEARLTLSEVRVDALLAQGDHQRALSELIPLCEDNPWRESLWRQRALALYRADRQTEALRLIAGFRGRLSEETGLEPSPTLVAL